MVAPGKGYNVFAGRDASKALGKSSMKTEDLSADYSELTEWELKVLDDWLAYYTKVLLTPCGCGFGIESSWASKGVIWEWGLICRGMILLDMFRMDLKFLACKVVCQ